MRAAGERVLSEAFKTSNLLQQTAESKFQFIRWKTPNLQDPIPESDG
jgi:hypothetical protein